MNSHAGFVFFFVFCGEDVPLADSSVVSKSKQIGGAVFIRLQALEVNVIMESTLLALPVAHQGGRFFFCHFECVYD